jgi:uncharacterized protein (DUF2342 family)
MTFPFGGENFLNDLLNIVSQQGPDAWRGTAEHLARSVARGEDGDPNPDPLVRSRLDGLTPLVARHLEAIIATPVPAACQVVTRVDFALLAIEEWAPLLERAVHTSPALGDIVPDEVAPMLDQMTAMMGPLLGGFQLGSAAGHFAQHAWSLGVLALPRRTATPHLHIGNLVTFAREWSIDLDTALTFGLAFELAAAAVLHRPGVADATGAVLLDALADARGQQQALFEQLGGLMQPGGMANPEEIFGRLPEPKPTAATMALETYTAVLREWCLVLAGEVTTAMVGSAAVPLEAVRRHFASTTRGEDAAAALFGLRLRGDTVALARTFVHDITTTVGRDALWALVRVDGAPSRVELESPTSWWERVSASPLA